MRLNNQSWYKLSLSQSLSILETNAKHGLSSEEVKKRKEIFGLNVIKSKKGENAFILFLKQFNQPLVYVLLLAVAGVAILQEWVEVFVILGVVLINAVVGFIQEKKALKAIDALSKNTHSKTTVIRDNQRQQINAAELVPGDIVILNSGDRVPADLRLISERELQINESALTGESVPVKKHLNPFSENTQLGDQTNMAFSSTLVTYGSGTGVVVGIGDHTEIGKINTMISSAEILITPLTKKINQFSHLLLWIILGLAAITITVGLIRGHLLSTVLLEGVALAVGAIPEGLPAVVTITLAIGVSRMAARKSIIRKLPAVETLGGTDVICSDKTGTLTQNEMTVQKIYTGNQEYDISGVGYRPEGKVLMSGDEIDFKEHPAVNELMLCGLLCNEARLFQKGDEWLIEGDPTEAALLSSAFKTNLDESLIKKYPTIDTIPFESENQFMATLHEVDQVRMIYIKGSAEKLLPVCNYTLDSAGNLKEGIDREQITQIVESFASLGLRVLAFARKEHFDYKIQKDDINYGLTFLGLQAMIDPPRQEAITAVETCRNAGVEVKMITGDHLSTAMAIARKLKLKKSASEIKGINGSNMASLSTAEFSKASEENVVFARVNPEQKLELVKALQDRGHVVAMTGDGVNDAPALRQSNIGIAMGITGTEVAKETADMILTDDNFVSIEAAVEEGRGVYDNLVKFITWTLPTNLSEGLVILIASLIGLSLPISPLQILWINMTTAILLGATLAMENKEPGIMQRAPRDPKIAILDKALMIRVIWVGLFIVAGVFFSYELAIRSGLSVAAAQTISINVIVFAELFYLFNTRSLIYSQFKLGLFTNRWLIGGVFAMIAMQMVFTYLPFMNQIFGTSPIGIQSWVLIIGIGLILYSLVEIEKLVRRKKIAVIEINSAKEVLNPA